MSLKPNFSLIGFLNQIMVYRNVLYN